MATNARVRFTMQRLLAFIAFSLIFTRPAFADPTADTPPENQRNQWTITA
jgi:hypothetical protein